MAVLTGVYVGNEFPDRKGLRIEIIRVKKGEYRIRFADGLVAKWIFESEIIIDNKN